MSDLITERQYHAAAIENTERFMVLQGEPYYLSMESHHQEFERVQRRQGTAPGPVSFARLALVHAEAERMK